MWRETTPLTACSNSSPLDGFSLLSALRRADDDHRIRRREDLKSAQPHAQVREDVEHGGLETELPQVVQSNTVNDHRQTF